MITGKNPNHIIVDELIDLDFSKLEHRIAIDYADAFLEGTAIAMVRIDHITGVRFMRVEQTHFFPSAITEAELKDHRQTLSIEDLKQLRAVELGYLDGGIRFIKTKPVSSITRILTPKEKYKYQQLQAQYNRAKAQRNKRLMRELEQQLVRYR